MSNTQFEIDNKISTLNTPSGHLDKDTLNNIVGSVSFATILETGTIAITTNGDTVLDFDATSGTTDSNYFTVASGVTTVVQDGTYEVNYNIMH